MTPAPGPARSVLAEISGRAASTLTPAVRLTDLGMDSLGRLTLAVLLEERTGRPLSDEALLKVRTVSDLDRLLEPTRHTA